MTSNCICPLIPPVDRRCDLRSPWGFLSVPLQESCLEQSAEKSLWHMAHSVYLTRVPTLMVSWPVGTLLAHVRAEDSHRLGALSPGGGEGSTQESPV